MELKNARIAFIALQAYPLFRAEAGLRMGGAEVQIHQLARILIEQYGCRARFICLAPRDGLETHGPIEVAAISRRHGALGKTRQIFRALEGFGADCVLQRSWGLETWIGARYAARRGKRFVFMAASIPDIQPPHPSDWLHWRRAAYRVGLRRAHAVVAQSEEQVAAFERHYATRATLIRSFQPPPEPRKEDQGYVLWVGRAIEGKRAELLLDLAERFPRIPFVLILNPAQDKEYYDVLCARAARLPNVRHVPYVPHTEIMPWFRGARLFVGTSVREGFPNTYLQAFRAWTPVLSLCVDPDHIIRKQRLGFVGDDDFEALARELERRYGDAEWVHETGRRAAEHVRAFHDPDRLANEWGDLLGRLLAPLKRPPERT